MAQKNRYTVIDILRTLSIISMVAYHTVWDLVYIYNVKMNWYHSKLAEIWQSSICYGFIILSGFCWSLGRRKFKRGITVFACSWIISAVTAVFMPESIILFGVLFLIGSGMLILILLDKLFCKIHPLVGIAVSIAVFVFINKINYGIVGIGKFTWHLSNNLYANNFTAALGFPSDAFVSMDYFPLLPWLFLYFAGYFLYHLLKKYDWLKYLSVVSFKPLELPGRYSLIIYMLHQPLIYGVLFVVFNCL